MSEQSSPPTPPPARPPISSAMQPVAFLPSSALRLRAPRGAPPRAPRHGLPSAPRAAPRRRHTAAAGAVAALRTCRVCKKRFDSAANGPAACRYHPGDWLGNENSKFFGVVKSANPDVDRREHERGTSFFYDCCEAREYFAEGCTLGPHKTYDEE